MAEANQHYRDGTGTPITISFGDIDTSDVTPTSFPDVNSKVVRCAKGTHQIDARTAYVTHGDIWYVLGSITLRLQGTLDIDCNCCWTFSGTLKSFDDKYDFDMHGNDPARDLATLAGQALAGKGKPFMIQIRGSKPMNAHGCFKGTSRKVNGL